MPIIKTSNTGQLVIPREIRKALGIKPGQRVLLQVAGNDRAELIPVPDNPVEAFCGVFGNGSSLVGTLLEERRKEKEREEQMAARLIRPAGVPEKRKKTVF